MIRSVYRHQDYLMRSFSETRWATMMDAIGVQWLYEPGTVTTRHGRYLPDFYLPGVDLYLEVKGPTPTAEEIEKGYDLRRETGKQVVFAYGDMRCSGETVCGGSLAVLRSDRVATFGTHVFAELIRHGLGDLAFHRYMRAGRAPLSFAVSMHDAIDGLILDFCERSDMEKARAELHTSLNAQRLAESRLPTKSEAALKRFFERYPIAA